MTTSNVPARLSDDELTRLTELRATVAANAERVAVLGGWADRFDDESLVSRIPTASQAGEGGFDAGVACALNLIPADRQLLATRLHGKYTTALVEQLRVEVEALTPDSQACWWLAGCAACAEGPVAAREFLAQVELFESLAADPTARLLAAQSELISMLTGFRVCQLESGPVPFARRDGGMQGAYLAGFDLAAHEATEYGLFFVGTFRRSLGLEDFAWRFPSDPTATTPDGRRGRSGPVGGSSNFVKAADRDELLAVLAAAHPHD